MGDDDDAATQHTKLPSPHRSGGKKPKIESKEVKLTLEEMVKAGKSTSLGSVKVDIANYVNKDSKPARNSCQLMFEDGLASGAEILLTIKSRGCTAGDDSSHASQSKQDSEEEVEEDEEEEEEKNEEDEKEEEDLPPVPALPTTKTPAARLEPAAAEPPVRPLRPERRTRPPVEEEEEEGDNAQSKKGSEAKAAASVSLNKGAASLRHAETTLRNTDRREEPAPAKERVIPSTAVLPDRKTVGPAVGEAKNAKPEEKKSAASMRAALLTVDTEKKGAGAAAALPSPPSRGMSLDERRSMQKASTLAQAKSSKEALQEALAPAKKCVHVPSPSHPLHSLFLHQLPFLHSPFLQTHPFLLSAPHR